MTRHHRATPRVFLFFFIFILSLLGALADNAKADADAKAETRPPVAVTLRTGWPQPPLQLEIL